MCASDDRHALVLSDNFDGATSSTAPSTATAGNRHALHALLAPFLIPLRSGRARSHGTDRPMATIVADGCYGGLIVPLRRDAHARHLDDPAPTVTASGTHHGLLMRNNTARGDDGQMVTSVAEPARTMTTRGHQSLLVPSNGHGVAHHIDEPIGTIPTGDRWPLVDPERLVDDCGFRMLEPYEIAAAMAFPDHYIPRQLTKRDQVRLAGNAVTPPVMAWVVGRVVQALEAAA